MGAKNRGSGKCFIFGVLKYFRGICNWIYMTSFFGCANGARAIGAARLRLHYSQARCSGGVGFDRQIDQHLSRPRRQSDRVDLGGFEF